MRCFANNMGTRDRGSRMGVHGVASPHGDCDHEDNESEHRPVEREPSTHFSTNLQMSRRPIPACQDSRATLSARLGRPKLVCGECVCRPCLCSSPYSGRLSLSASLLRPSSTLVSHCPLHSSPRSIYLDWRGFVVVRRFPIGQSRQAWKCRRELIRAQHGFESLEFRREFRIEARRADNGRRGRSGYHAQRCGGGGARGARGREDTRVGGVAREGDGRGGREDLGVFRQRDDPLGSRRVARQLRMRVV
jgi:hypothetical protein